MLGDWYLREYNALLSVWYLCYGLISNWIQFILGCVICLPGGLASTSIQYTPAEELVSTWKQYTLECIMPLLRNWYLLGKN
jgi:hypothetical protein